MRTIVQDPLLSAARILLIFLIGVLGFAIVIMAIGLPALVIFSDAVAAEMAAEGIANGGELIAPLALVMAAIIGLLALAIWFLVLLRRIVNSVGEGDPFAAVNAERLRRMGWLTLIGQLAVLPVGAMVLWMAEIIGDQGENVRADIDGGFSPAGLLLTLVLFILARVFRKGTEMREDLEGTV